jgi:hypothetical protein
MKDFFLKWGLPVFIFLMVGHQFYQVYVHNLTRWKGGGFGMYSQIHPQDRRVWVVTPDSSWMIQGTKTRLEKKAHTLRFFPNQQALRDFADLVSKTYALDTLSIEIWEPYLSPETNTPTRKKIAYVAY